MTHLILIFDEDESYIKNMIENSFDIWKNTKDYSDIFSISSYRIVVALPNFDQKLVEIARNYEAVAKEKDINYCVNVVDARDLDMWSCKFGLIACSKWTMFGGVLLNNTPLNISGKGILSIVRKEKAGSTLLILKKKGWFDVDYNMAIIKDERSFDYLFKNAMRFPSPYDHKFEDVIKFLERNCKSNEIVKIKI